jgi:4-diphosphocytidyl-2C-methyl-D-erythritol kinase
MSLETDMLGPRSDAAGLRRWLAGETDEMPELYNTFEQALEPAYPALRRLREAMFDQGALLSRLSGSGSAVFGIFESERTRDHAANALKEFGDAFLCASSGRRGVA